MWCAGRSSSASTSRATANSARASAGRSTRSSGSRASIARAMRTEYQAIVDAGLYVQLDDARLAVTYDRMVPPASFTDYRRWAEMHVEVLNEALAGIAPERVRYHVCWGSWPGPHTTDVPLNGVVDLILKVNAGAYLIEGAKIGRASCRER